MNFADLIFHHALTRPAKPAVILPDRVATYGMMAQGILSVTDRLAALNLKRGAVVAVAIASPIRHLIAVAALYRLGHPAVSVSRTAEIPALRLPIAAYLESEAGALVPGLNQVVVGEDWFTAPPRRFAATPSRGFASGDEICRIALSSGTTGLPKAFSWSVDATQSRIDHYYLSIGQGNWDRMLCLPALSSAWGLNSASHALYAGKTLCFVADAAEALRMIAIHNVDCLIASPQHLRELIEDQRRQPVPCPSLRVIFAGGALPSRALLNEARASLCSHIVVQYGSTEAGGTAFATVDRLLDTEGAVGYVFPSAEVQAIDEAGRVLLPGTDGTLRIRCGHLARPYPPGGSSPSDEIIHDGWFYPGDRGRVTEDGMLIVTGRVAEFIDTGRGKLAPEAIEDVVRAHPDIADVAALAGMGLGGVGEIWIAIVSRSPVSAADLIAFCAAKGLTIGRVAAVASIPRNSAGKIERDRLRREIQAKSRG